MLVNIFGKTHKNHRIALFVVAVFFALQSVFGQVAQAAIPGTMGYQGRLKNSSGTLQTGTFSFTFRLYSSLSGGSALWTETQSSVSVDSGVFAVQLGSVTPFSDSFDFTQPLYLTTDVNSTGEMSPRIPIDSVAYAMTTAGVNALPTAPVSATGGRMYYDTADGSLNYYDAFSGLWRSVALSSSLTWTNATGTNTTSTNLFANTANILAQNVTNLTVTGTTSLQSTNFTSGTSTVWLGYTTASGTTLTALNLTGTNFTTGNATITGGTVSGVTINNSSIGATTPSTGVFTNTTSTNATTTAFFATNAIITNLATTNFTPTNVNATGLIWTSATGTNTTSTSLFANTANILAQNVTNLTVTGTTSLQGLSFTSGTSSAWLGFAIASGTTVNATAATIAALTTNNATIGGGSMNGTAIGNTSASTGIFTNTTSTAATSTVWLGYTTASGTTLTALNLNGTNFTTGNATITGGTISGATINNSSIGAITPSTGVFTDSTSTNATSTSLFANTSNLLTANVTNLTVTGTTSLQGLSFVNGTSTVWLGFAIASGTTVNANSATIATLTTDNATIGGGSINGTIIGGVTPSTAIFSNTTTTNATTTALAFTSASGTILNATNFTSENVTITGGSISLGGSSVCLANGTNCPVPAGGGTLASVTNVANGYFATTTLQFYGGFLTASSTVTSSFTVLGDTTLQAATATNVTTTNFYTGTSFRSGASTSTFNAVSGTVFVAGAGSTSQPAFRLYSSNAAVDSSAVGLYLVNGTDLGLRSSGGSVLWTGLVFEPDQNNSRSLGRSAKAWSNFHSMAVTSSQLFASNVSSTNATTTNLEVKNNLLVTGSTTSTFFAGVSSTRLALTLTDAASAGLNPLCREANGMITEGAAGICPVSALEIKKDIKPISYGLKEVLRTQFIDYRFKVDDGMTHSGVVADWTDGYMPQLTIRDKQGKIIGFDQFSFSGVLGQAIKEQQIEIDELKVQIKELQETATGTRSEVVTDRVIAGLDIVTPTLTTQHLELLGDLHATGSLMVDGFVSVSSIIAGAISSPELAGLHLERGVTVSGEALFQDGLRVNQISSLTDLLTLQSDTFFFGRPYVNADTAGFVIVREGDRSVTVQFGREYLTQPVINATVAFENTEEATSTRDARFEQLFLDDVRYVITQKSVHGFTILLNKPAPQDVSLSWIALAVKDARIILSSPVDSEEPEPEPVPAVEPEPESVVEPEPVLEPEPEPEPVPQPEVVSPSETLSL